MENSLVVLVTGGSSGIGLAIVKLLAEQGYIVYAAARRPQPEQVRPGSGFVQPIIMDVASEASVSRGVSDILLKQGRLDAVVHCAGMGVAGPAEDTPDADAHDQMEVNYFGILRVNRHVLPAMRRQGGGRVILIGSVGGLIPVPYHAHYCASKFALEAYGEALYNEAREFGIRVTLVEPGDTRTGFTAARRHAVPEGSPYTVPCKRAVAVMEHDEQNGVPPETVARVVLRQLKKANPALRVVVGMGYKLLVLVKKLLPTRFTLWMIRKVYKLDGVGK